MTVYEMLGTPEIDCRSGDSDLLTGQDGSSNRFEVAQRRLLPHGRGVAAFHSGMQREVPWDGIVWK